MSSSHQRGGGRRQKGVPLDAFLKEMKENNGEDDDEKRRERIECDDEFDEFDEEEENFQPLPPPRETLLETERVLKRATKEQLSSSMTGEMPAKEQMEKL